jgi:glutamate synthase (NADPH/NADH) large chain
VLAAPAVPFGGSGSLRCTKSQVHDFSLSLDGELIMQSKKALAKKEPVSLFASIRNCNRTVGATLAAEVSKRYGSKGLPEDTIKCKFTGTAGQSFGGFLAPGITFELEGDANDYFGKGLSGGKLIVYPPKSSTFRPQNNIITGNVNLFGATSGEAYINGMAGERFAVRNSGATAVVEGVGDHACEYMTGGTVVVLGTTGRTFGAGMTGGLAFVLDIENMLRRRLNEELVRMERISSEADEMRVRGLVTRHVDATDSAWARAILADWPATLTAFWKVAPK